MMRIATGLLFGALLFFVGRTCQSEHADIELVFENRGGEAISNLSAELHRDGERVGYFEVAAMAPYAERRWKLDLDPGTYQLVMEMNIGSEHERVTQPLEAIPRSTVWVGLNEGLPGLPKVER